MKFVAMMMGVLCLVAVPQAGAQVQVEKAWVRATVAQQKVTGAFMQIKAKKDARLIGVTSPAAGVVEIHEMKKENDVMRMRLVDTLALPAEQIVELKPGGYHLMLMELKAPLQAGQKVPFELIVEQGGKRVPVNVEAVVRALDAVGAAQ